MGMAVSIVSVARRMIVIVVMTFIVVMSVMVMSRVFMGVVVIFMLHALTDP
jgi:hypothetical protein